MSSEKKQRETTKFCVVWRTYTRTANFLNFDFKLTAVLRSAQIQTIAPFQFLLDFHQAQEENELSWPFEKDSCQK